MIVRPAFWSVDALDGDQLLPFRAFSLRAIWLIPIAIL